DAFPYFNARDALRGMALFELDAGRDPEPWVSRAEEEFKKGIERNSKLAGSYVEQARVIEIRIRNQIALGKNPSAAVLLAKSYVKKALELDPGKNNALVARGVISMLEGQWQPAETDLRKAMQDAPNNTDPPFFLCELFLL